MLNPHGRRDFLLVGVCAVERSGRGQPRRERLKAKGLDFAGMSPDGPPPETVERENHPWFIGVQYHPELKSRPFEPRPLVASFIAAAKAQSRLA
jgi:CTP synthase (UTP-ammonia lyase)